MIPSDGTVVIDGIGAFDVDFTGVDPAIHSIHWYGTSGQVEYVYDPVTDTKNPNTDFTSLAPYQGYVDQAQAIINAALNPDIYYATIANYPWQGGFYPIGSEIVVSTPNTPQPPDTTNLQPPTLLSFQSLFWGGSSWVASPVDPALTLADAKTFLIRVVKTSAASLMSKQSRIYSTLELATSVDPASLLCADFPTTTLGNYQTTLANRVQQLTQTIQAATQLPNLYGIDPNVDPSPV